MNTIRALILAIAGMLVPNPAFSSDFHSGAFNHASINGVIGESSNLFLIPPGYYFHPLHNDVTGATDKLLTASAKLGTLMTLGEHSVEIIGFRRLLTPAVKPAFLHDDLEKPVGRYADWSEVEAAYAHTMYIGTILTRWQVALGYSHIGDKGGREFHRWVHRVTNNSLENLDYSDQPEGLFFTPSLSIGLVLPSLAFLERSFEQLVSLQAETSKMMQETGIAYNALWMIRKGWWELATEIRVIRQIDSQEYESIKPLRYEAVIGAKLWHVYTPMLKYVGPYLQGDPIGQSYFDFIHLNFRW